MIQNQGVGNRTSQVRSFAPYASGCLGHFASNQACPVVRKYPGREREHKEGVLSKVKRVVGVLATSALLVGSVSSTALAINDPIVPGDNCAPENAQAVGHPASSNNQTPAWAANPPFSLNNPGVSTGAQGSEHSQAFCDA